MGVRRLGSVGAVRGGCGILSLVSIAVLLGGCVPVQQVAVRRLLAHQALLDYAGLGPVETVPALNMTGRLPLGWEPLPLQVGPLYRHQQWRSPSHATGVGVAAIHLPIPLSAKWILWFAKLQYAKREGNKSPTGALLSEWTDSVGREWFEAENDRYHVRGYAVTSGCDAWIIYSGYRRRAAMDLLEEGLAARSVDTVLPLPLLGKPALGAVAAAPEHGGLPR